NDMRRAPGTDRSLGHISGDEIALLVQLAEDAPDSGPEEAQAAVGANRINAELARIELLPFAEPEQVHLVNVVADEQQRRADRRLQTRRADPEFVAAEMADRLEARREHCHALRATLFLLLELAQPDHVRIEADRA